MLKTFKFDEYEIRARISPALLVTLPVVAAVYTFVVPARTFTGVMSGTVVESAFLYLLARIARDKGKRVQEKLYRKWGGKPTTSMLRHSDTRIDPLTKERYKVVMAKMAGVAMPSAETERLNPESADYAYDSAVKSLIEKRRSKTYKLVFAENCNFGFMRNLLGLKPIGLTLAFSILVLEGVLVWKRSGTVPDSWSIPAVASLCMFILLLLITETSVKRAAEAYAEALLRTCEVKSIGTK